MICGFIAGLIYDLTSASPVALWHSCLWSVSYFHGPRGRDRMLTAIWYSMGFVALQTFGVTFM